VLSEEGSAGDNMCVLWILFLTTAGFWSPVFSGNPDAKRLYDELLSNYNKLVRPVVNTSDVLKVRIRLKLSQLIDVVSGKFLVWELGALSLSGLGKVLLRKQSLFIKYLMDLLGTGTEMD